MAARRGSALACARGLDAVMRDLISAYEAGDVTEIVFAARMTNGDCMTGVTETTMVYEMLGQVRWLEHKMIKQWMEED